MNINLNSVEVRVTIVVVFFLAWFFYRLYKKFIIRRGKKRFSKILLPPKERISWRSPITGKLRWVIRHAVKLTFTDSGDGLELVKFDTDPITVLHAFKEKLINPDQYHLDGLRFVRATEQLLQLIQLILSRHQGSGDIPPLSLRMLFEDFFNGVNKPPESQKGEGGPP